MKVTLNGQVQEIAAGTLDQALIELGYGGATIATAVNGTFVPRTQRHARVLQEGDRIEVVAPMQGG